MAGDESESVVRDDSESVTRDAATAATRDAAAIRDADAASDETVPEVTLAPCAADGASQAESAAAAAEARAAEEWAGVGKVDAEAVLDAVGPFGAFQAVWYVLLCIPAGMTATLNLSFAFTAVVPAHRCAVPRCDNSNSTFETAFTSNGFSRFALPADADSPTNYSQCRRFAYVGGDAGGCDATSFDPAAEYVNCSRHLYDRGEFQSTVATEFDLACDKDWQLRTMESVYFAAVLVFSFPWGYLADKLGRRVCLLAGIIITMSFGVASSMAPSFVSLVALLVLCNIGQTAIFQTCFILAVENVGKAYRTICGTLIEFFFVAGEALLCMVAYFTRNWRHTLLWVTLPMIGFLFYYPFLPESLRWQILHRKFVVAQQTADRIAKYNGKDRVKLRDYAAPADEESRAENLQEDRLRDACKSGKLMLRSAVVWYGWFVVSLAYYGLSLNAATLVPGDVYLNFLLLSLVEIPGYAVSYAAMQWWGRRPALALSFAVGGACCIGAPFVPAEYETAKIALFLLGKVGVTSAFGTIYLYTSELFPTSFRTAGVGVASTFARVGAMISPYVAMSDKVAKWLPLVLFGSATLLGGILSLILPETLGVELPRTLQEAIDLGGESRRRPAERSTEDNEPLLPENRTDN